MVVVVVVVVVVEVVVVVVVVGGWLQEGRNSWHVKSSIEDFKLCFGVVCLVAFTTVLISDDITSYNSLNSRFIKKQ